MNKSESVEQQPQASKRNPYTPWFVVIAFVAPVLASYSLYFLGYKPSSFDNRGELITPVIDIESFALTNEQNELMTSDDIAMHKWHMILFVGAGCDDACQQSLYKLRQINIAAGKNANRLQRLLVHLEAPDEEFQKLLAAEYPNARHANAKAETISSALQNIGPNFHSNEVYIMDPNGNIMLRFTQEQSYKELLHDLNTMFKVSQIG